jgi:nitrogen fixation protein FixH
MKAFIAAVTVTVLALIVGTIWLGAHLMEPTVVKDPYEHGLHHDQERHDRERLGWHARFDPASLRAGGAAVGFQLLDGQGAPLDGAAIEVALTRPAGGGEPRAGRARALGQGRYQLDAGFAAPGFWDVRLDVARGAEVAGLVQQVRVEATAAGPAACDLAAAPCTAEAGGLQVTLDLGRTLATMKELPASVTVRRGGAPVDGAAVEVAFAMKDMNMGENRVALSAAGPGRFTGTAILVRCVSGKRDWIASVTVRLPGAAPASVQLPFAVAE